MSDIPVGPVCHIPAATQPANPIASGVAGIGAPPRDLPTALASIAQLQNVVRQLTQQLVQNNTTTFSIRSDGGDKKTQWIQKDIVTEKIKVYQNNDSSSPNWVEIERTNGLTMVDKATGGTWVYKRNGA